MDTILSRHKQAERYLLKLKLMGLDNMVKLDFCPNDQVTLVRVNNTWSTGKFIVPRFVTGMQASNSLHGMFQLDINFEGCRFTELYVDNGDDVEFDATYMCASMECEHLKIHFSHPECVTKAFKMFSGCFKLKTLDACGLDLTRCGDIHNIFEGCKLLTKSNIHGLII